MKHRSLFIAASFYLFVFLVSLYLVRFAQLNFEQKQMLVVYLGRFLFISFLIFWMVFVKLYKDERKIGSLEAIADLGNPAWFQPANKTSKIFKKANFVSGAFFVPLFISYVVLAQLWDIQLRKYFVIMQL